MSRIIRQPLPVRARRFWRLAFRSQSSGFKTTAALMAAVLAAGVGTAIVGVGGSGTSTLQSDNGGPGASNGPTAGPSASAAPGKTAGPGAKSGSGGGKAGNGSGQGGTPGGSHGSTPGCRNAAGHTDAGVDATSIKVVFPIANIQGVQQAFSFSGSFSSEDARQSVAVYVNAINKRGGINCRTIKAITPDYNPADANDTSMRALCKQYTVDEPTFAFVDGLGAWHDSGQLCVTQEHHTPLISGWTGTTSQLNKGRPYLWWTGPDLCNVLRNLVSWAVSTGKLTKKTKFGVVYTTSTTDVEAYNKCLIPALTKQGLTPRDHGQLTYSTAPNQSTGEAPIIASRFHAEQITTVIPMLPFFQFVSWVNGEQNQSYAPKLLLSDYDSQLTIALGLVGESGSGNKPFPTPYTTQLQDQGGPTYGVLGNADHAPYASPLGDYCLKEWQKVYPATAKKPAIEATGTAMTTCQNTELFAQAATMAGNNLTRAGFAAAMARINSFNGGVVPNLHFNSSVSSGPHLQREVVVHNNTDDKCPKKIDGGNQGNCWLVKSQFTEQRLASL